MTLATEPSMTGMPKVAVVPNLVSCSVGPSGPSKYSKSFPAVANKSLSKSHCPVISALNEIRQTRERDAATKVLRVLIFIFMLILLS